MNFEKKIKFLFSILYFYFLFLFIYLKSNSQQRKSIKKSITVMSDSAGTTVTGFTNGSLQDNNKQVFKAAMNQRNQSVVDEILSEKSTATSKLQHDKSERLSKRRMSSKKIQLVQQWLDDKLNNTTDNQDCYVNTHTFNLLL